MAERDSARVRVWPALAAAAAVALTAVAAAQEADKQPAPAGRSFALLVGVTEFIAPAMKKHNLQGPANDVALFRSVLTSQAFGTRRRHRFACRPARR